MSIFIDTGIFIAFFNKRDEKHKHAVELLRSAMSGDFGTLYTSDYIFDEAITFTIRRTNRIDLAQTIGNFILGKLKGYPKLFTVEKLFEGFAGQNQKIMIRYACCSCCSLAVHCLTKNQSKNHQRFFVR